MTTLGRETQYAITVEELKDLMKHHGTVGLDIINTFGGIEGICKMVNTTPDIGLSGLPDDLEKRRAIFGANIIPQKETKSFVRLMWEALQDFTLIILLISAIISLGVYVYKKFSFDDEVNNDNGKYEWIEGVGILVCVFIVVIISAFNDYTKERQFQSLKNRIRAESKFSVLRQGEIKQINVNDIVVGDICFVKYGDLLPADGILIQSNDLKVDESSLTGESHYRKKGQSRDLMLFSGTHVVEGRGEMLVTAVGLNSRVGIIYSLLGVVGKQRKNKVESSHTELIEVVSVSSDKSRRQDSVSNVIGKKKSVLQEKLTKLAIYIGCIGIFFAVITGFLLIIQFCIKTFVVDEQPWNKSYIKTFVNYFVISITVLVVSIPEGLPLAVTLSLACSVIKMTKDNILVRHLDACETMGCVTTICSDKTGTLTTNNMTVVESYICNKLYKSVPQFSSIPLEVGKIIVQAISINSSYSSRIIPSDTPGGLGKSEGNKTECALLQFLLALGQNYQTIRDQHPEKTFTRVYTFNSLRKSMSTVIPKDSGGYLLFIKGASEILLRKCAFMYDENGLVTKLTKEMQTNLEHSIIETMARNDLRTILVAYREFSRSEPNWDEEWEICKDLTVLCILGIQDPIRPEVPKAIKKCQMAGITVRMVTGDNINTARSIALKCGILNKGNKNEIMDGDEFDHRIRDEKGQVQQDLLDKVWPKLRVLARATPIHKYILVKGIMESKISDEVVAVTGDGTNDGPALKFADVGISMGIAGTDIAKEASDIIITDDNFSSIVNAVVWGRNIYDNIGKFLQFQLTVNVVAVVIVFVSSCAIQNTPLKAIQILWVNLIMDSLASLALATEAPTKNLLNRKPYGRTKPVVSHFMGINIIGHSFYQLGVIMFLLFYGDKLLDIPSGRDFSYGSPPNLHFTVIFNSFIMMTQFNEINCRKLHRERNVFSGLFSNPIFNIIWLGTASLQVIIVEYGGLVFSTHKLQLDQWLWCIFFGLGSLIWGQLLNSMPISMIPGYFTRGEKKSDNYLKFIQKEERNKPQTKEKTLWIRGSRRVQNQLDVISAFKTSVIDSIETKNGRKWPKNLKEPV